MGVLLEIKAGPMAGKVLTLTTGQTLTFGRATGRADFALPHDTFMSGLHFVVECGATACRVVDRKSSNGTFLNGAKIQDAVLANGDEIKSGQTIFTVRIMADAKLASMAPPSIAESARDSASPAEVAPQAVPAVPRAARPPVAEPRVPPPAPRAVEPSRAVLDSALSPAAGSESAADDASPWADQPAKRVPPRDDRAGDRAAPPAEPAEPPPKGGSRVPEPPVRDVPSGDIGSPRREEPPRLRAIPTPSRGVPIVSGPRPSPPRGAEPPVSAPRPPVPQRPAERPRSPGTRGAAFSVMGWSFPAAPAEWLVQEGFGLQQTGHEDFPSSVAASEELLGGITLQQFVESQISMLRRYLRDPRIEPSMPPRVGGADESMAVDVRHSTKDGRELVYRRIYARSGASVGVLTVTTLADELPKVLQSLQPLLDGAAFRGTVGSE